MCGPKVTIPDSVSPVLSDLACRMFAPGHDVPYAVVATLIVEVHPITCVLSELRSPKMVS
jgi:hypothetical protein